MKFVVDLPPNSPLNPGTVFHTLGYPEPEIFGFLYVHPDNVASLGIFVLTTCFLTFPVVFCLTRHITSSDSQTALVDAIIY